MPVIHLDVNAYSPALLLWDRLDKHDRGQQQLESVPRGDLDQLLRLLAHLLADEAGAAPPVLDHRRRPMVAVLVSLLGLALPAVTEPVLRSASGDPRRRPLARPARRRRRAMARAGKGVGRARGA